MCPWVEKSRSTSDKGLMNQIIKSLAVAPFRWKGGRGDSPHWRYEMSWETIRIGVQRYRLLRLLKFLRFLECASSRPVISTDGICAEWKRRVVRFYVRQKWRNLKAVASYFASCTIIRYGTNNQQPTTNNNLHATPKPMPLSKLADGKPRTRQANPKPNEQKDYKYLMA